MKFSYEQGAKGLKRHYSIESRSRKVVQYKVFALLFVVAISLTGMGLSQRDHDEIVANALPASEQTLIDLAEAQQMPDSPTFASTQKVFTADIQKWLKNRTSSYGVYVGATDGTAHAEVNADAVFSSESIYKLYVAYLGYQQIDSKIVDSSQIYNAGKTRLQCLDVMIRTSDSPCAEKLTSEMGKLVIDARLKAYGLTHTSVRGLTTTPRDAATLLTLIQKGTDLSSDSKARLLDSMRLQQYRNGIPRGFVGSTTYNKVGFRDMAVYNDVALVTLASGRTVVVTIFTKNLSVKKIALLSTEISRHLQQ